MTVKYNDEESKFPTPRNYKYYGRDEINAWFKLAIEDFPKEQVDSRVGGDGDEYNWYSYDFDEINEWHAKWLQQFKELL